MSAAKNVCWTRRRWTALTSSAALACGVVSLVMIPPEERRLAALD